MKEKGKCYSKVNRGQRRKGDTYSTPLSMTRQLFEVETWDAKAQVLEPAAGQGAIVLVLKEHFKNIKAFDIETNFLKFAGETDYIITNPPYSLANEFIIHAKEVTRYKFAFLLPLVYLHGKERYEKKVFKGLEWVHVFTRMPMLSESIRDNGTYKTGMQVYAWFVWNRSYYGHPKINWIDNTIYCKGRDE